MMKTREIFRKLKIAFILLKTQDLIHNINNPSLFRCEYRSPDKFLARNVRFKVEIIIVDPANIQTNTIAASVVPQSPQPLINNAVSNTNPILSNNINLLNNNSNSKTNTSSNSSYKILFTLINGSTKQFHQLCKHICNLISMNYSQVHSQHHRQQQQQLQLQQQRLQKQVFLHFIIQYKI